MGRQCDLDPFLFPSAFPSTSPSLSTSTSTSTSSSKRSYFSSSSSPSLNSPFQPCPSSSSFFPSSSFAASTTDIPVPSPPSSSPSASSPSSSPSPPAAVILSPCAACKILRRRCVEKCVLAPYFPPTEPYKFTIAQRVFGASNILKFLQDLPESQRADAVSSMVYEANARIRDPVYGSAGAICQLQNQVNELQAQLAKAQATIANLQCQQARGS